MKIGYVYLFQFILLRPKNKKEVREAMHDIVPLLLQISSMFKVSKYVCNTEMLQTLPHLKNCFKHVFFKTYF